MDDETAQLARSIGGLVRRYRTERSWTLDRLAEEAGVSRRMLISVEQGAVNPSVGTLLRLSAALRIPLTALVDLPEPAAAHVTRSGTGPVLWTGEHGGRGALVAATPSGLGELWDWTLRAGERHDSEAHSDGTRELLQVQEGRLLVETDGRAHTLEAGDGIAFAGDTAHAYADLSGATTRFTLAVVEPVPGAIRRDRTHA